MSSALLLMLCGLLAEPQVARSLPSTDPSAAKPVEQDVEQVALGPVAQAAEQTASAGNSSDLVQKVLQIQRSKCLDCHGPNSDKRKAVRKYPDALDLAATVEEWVVPGDPLDSDFFLMLEDGEMPPDDSEVAPLSPEELKIYRDWIEVGAPIKSAEAVEVPVESAESIEASVADSTTEAVDEPVVQDTEQLPLPSITEAERMRRFIGRQHPAVVHFPIGLILSAALLELLIMFRRREGWLHAQRFCLRFGALMAAVSAGLGFMLTEFTMTTDELWLHGGLAGAALLCSLNAARAVPPAADARRNRFRLWMGAAALLISATGFMGGYLVFGWDYLKY